MTARPVIQKHDYIRSRAWLDWVRDQPSCVSGMKPCDAHHLKLYSSITGSGGSIKGDDLYAIPLTREEHMEGDTIGWYTWEERHGSQLVHWAKLMGVAVRSGAIKLLV